MEQTPTKENDLQSYVKKITSGEDVGLDEVVSYMKNNPDDIQDIVQRVSDEYPGQSLQVAVRLGSLIEKLVKTQ